MKKKIIEPFKNRNCVDDIMNAKKYLLSYYQKSKLYIVLRESIISRIEMDYLDVISESSLVYEIANKNFIIDLFDTDVYALIKDIKIVGLNSSHKVSIKELEKVLSHRPFHSNAQLIELVDLYFYSENNFETIILIN